MSRAVVICPGSRFAFDGEVVEVTGFEGTRVTLRDARDQVAAGSSVAPR